MIKAGVLLKEKREEKGLSLEDVAKSTKIKTVFLSAIEKGEYKNLPSSAYAAGFVRSYAKFLGVGEKEIMPIFRREFDAPEKAEILPKGLSADIPIRRFRIKNTIILVSLALLALLSYLIFQYRFAFINPPLDVEEPKQNEILQSQDIVVTGSTEPNSTVSVNGEETPVDADGSFTKYITLFPGENVIEVKALSRFGRESSVERRVEVKPQ